MTGSSMLRLVFARGCRLLAAALCAFACQGQDGRSLEKLANRAHDAAVARDAQSGQPVIDFDTRIHDFGLVNEGDPLKHEFQVANKGAGMLLLSGASTSCGCAVALLGATRIPPGGGAPLSVSMDTHGVRGKGSRAIMVSSNDPRQPTSTLEIRYDVERLLGLDRSFVRLTTAHGARRLEDVWLVGQLLEQAKPRVARIDGGGLVSARVIKTRTSGGIRKGLRLELRGQRRTSGKGTVTLATGVKVPPELSLPFEYAVD